MNTNAEKRVVITGASTGIGRATVAAAVQAGFAVLPTVRRQQDADALVAAHGDRVTPLIVDLTDADAVAAAGRTISDLGPLYALINNAGASYPGPLEYLPLDDLRAQLEVNVVGQLAMIQAVLPALRRRQEESGDARIVVIGSIGGRVAAGMLGAYQASKHAIVGLVGSLRAELAPSGIQVVLLEPGTVATAIWDSGSKASDRMVAGLSDEARQRYAAQLDGARAFARRGARGLAADKAGAKVVASLTSARPAPRQVIGRDAQTMAVLVRLLPFRAIYRMTAARA